MTYDLKDVNKAADDFLRELEKGNFFYREESLEIKPLNLPGYVLLMRRETPSYFCGFKPSGRPVFSHDLKLAKSFKHECLKLEQETEKLKVYGIPVVPYPTDWHEGRNDNVQF